MPTCNALGRSGRMYSTSRDQTALAGSAASIRKLVPMRQILRIARCDQSVRTYSVTLLTVRGVDYAHTPREGAAVLS